jgi:protein kinase-like protein
LSVHIPIGVGSEFLGYRLEEVIGQGGMGVVYRAYDLRLKRTVALKLVSPDLAQDDRFRERFARETELAISLEHPNVIPIHDAGDLDGRVYLTMRLVEGTDLRALLRARGALEPARALAICRQVANALDAAHAKGLVHRDVKPSNVLLDHDDHAYLADFGLSRRLDEEAVEFRPAGTPAYLAPELIEGASADGRADVYSLGCVLFECLTGKPPFERDSRLAVAWAHLEEQPPRASQSNTDLPAAIDAVVAKAMAKRPGDRYETCAALIAHAADALGLRKGPLASRRLLIVALAVLGVLVAGLAAVLATRGESKRVPPTVRANSLVRLDPQTNTISRVIDVGAQPMATAVGGRNVWVYSVADYAVSEIDADSGKVRNATVLPSTPPVLGLLSGPVLAADEARAWIIATDAFAHGLLIGVRSQRGGARTYKLGLDPAAVAVGESAVWVVGLGSDTSELVRVDPASGRVTNRMRFPRASDITSVAVGLGAVWAVAYSTGEVYRIDPRTVTVSAHADLGQRVGRLVFISGSVWVHVSDGGGTTLLVDPKTLKYLRTLDCCRLDEGMDEAAGFGSSWTNDSTTGTTVRWKTQSYKVANAFRLTDPPFFGGLCLTSIAAGAGGVWVTVAPATDHTCPW